MMRLALAFSLSLLLFLVRGSDHLYARAFHHPNCYTPAKLSQKSEQAGLGGVKNSRPQIRQAALDDAILATEEVEDDDDFTPSRKYVELRNYFLTLFYNPVTGNFNQYRKDRLPFCKHFSYTSSYKYILYRVIRI